MDTYNCNRTQHIWIVTADGWSFRFTGISVLGHLKVLAQYQNREAYKFSVAEGNQVYETSRGVLEQLAVGSLGQTYARKHYRMVDILFWSELPIEVQQLVRRVFPRCASRLDRNAEPI